MALKVLVACEESQAVCKAFRELGHEAYSCDIQECSGGHPEWHLKQDVLPLLQEKWDLIIAHPPCTYLTNGGAVRMFRREVKEYPPYGTFQMMNLNRLKEGMLARDFFMSFLNAPCERVAIENPVPMSFYMLPPASQIIQPYMFGDPFSKKLACGLKVCRR